MQMDFRFLPLLLLGWIALPASPPSIEFDGTRFHLASVDVGADGAITNEYVQQGENLQNWTTRLAVRQWPRAGDIREPANAWAQAIRPRLARKIEAFQAKDAVGSDDVTFEAWVAAPDRSHIEANLYRFVVEPDVPGVKAYQFAEKIVVDGGQGDPSIFLRKRGPRLEALRELRITAHEQADEAKPAK